MALTIITLSLLLVGLGLSQAWMLWYIKRETARLDQRLDESLDDQDLLDFQERLQQLLEQAREAGSDMVQTVQQRQDALEKTLVLVREAEKNLVARAQILQKSADAIGKRAEKLKEEALEKKIRRAAPKKLPPPARETPKRLEADSVAEDEGEETAQAERARSYLVRPSAAPSPAPVVGGRHQKVYELSDQGLSRDQIAKESGILPGEVELILNLRPRRKDR